MKKIVLLTLLLCALLQAYSQQDSHYSLYMFNPLVVNPGYAGSREVLSAVLVHRSQWIGLEGAPETQALAINTPLRNKKMGVGLQIMNDEIGAHTNQTLKATYAYRLKLGGGKLAFGLNGGILKYNYDWAKIEYKENEDIIPTNSSENFTIPTVDFGIYYNTKTFYLGFNTEHLNEAGFGLGENQNVSTANGEVNSGSSKKEANLITTFGKAFVLNDNLVIKTSFLVRFTKGAATLDVNSSILMKNKVLLGLSLRRNALIVLTEINLTKKLRMGIGYDLDASNIAKSSSGSVELFIGYDVGLFKSKTVSPRYF